MQAFLEDGPTPPPHQPSHQASASRRLGTQARHGMHGHAEGREGEGEGAGAAFGTMAVGAAASGGGGLSRMSMAGGSSQVASAMREPRGASPAAGGPKAEDSADDAASDGGQSNSSALSGMSAASGASSGMAGGGHGGADYKRGKRFRKLANLMDSPPAQALLLRFKSHGLWTLAAMAALHVACFALIIHFVASQSAALTGLTRAATVDYALIKVRAMPCGRPARAQAAKHHALCC